MLKMGLRPEGGDGVFSASPVTSVPLRLFLYSFFSYRVE